MKNRAEELKNTMAAMFTTEPAEPTEKQEQEQEAAAATKEAQPKKRHRRSIIDKDPLPGLIPGTDKKKRIRAKKPAALRKSHTMTILITEQTFQRFKKICEQQELSMNGVVGRLIRKYIMLHDIDQEDLTI